MLSKRLLSLCAGCVIAASATAQVTITTSTSAFFDISGTGTAIIGVADDSAHSITTTVGNDLFPAGPVMLMSNGYAAAPSSTFSSPYVNAAITGTTTGAIVGHPTTAKVVMPFWDDLYGSGAPNATIYYQETGGVLYLQWQNIGHFATSSAAGGPGITFQLQVIGGGGCLPSVIHMVYPDATFGGVQAINDNGASATVGYVGGTAATNAQYSFNTASIPDGTSLTIVYNSWQQAWSSPGGTGSIQYNVCGGSPSGTYQLLVTLNAGLFPNGWLYGIDITYPELLSEIGLPPFLGLLDGSGAAQIGPISGVPSGLTVFSIAFDIPPGSVPTIHTPPATYTVP